ncbi:hypothetical protein BA184_00590 [Helicobacter pullorum]|uniref:glycosyltransferase n=1 Tax=Helicobacter pullorum TaxID=35818 RepID=UPI0008169307|nr:glycosyltransferase [Helicobacter pullorum]OCR05327.1 hypothetical protein BA729_00445 [Helicobacter pullorum]OCR07895.1 hypothetical protein BA185_02280 [Helicobacter pullorum]OCR11885.1 hypothetical protein BA184_00590 [Helicobacter pullorum]OCR12801.1 hypothetical protein BA730_03295 [Helicobacter pullorum]
MTPVKFFIIIPIYNVESYLHKCLDSIICQTYKNFEVICVNDGSTDKSLEIAKSYADSDSRFTLTSQANQGQSVARNKALDIAKQKWLESSQEEQEQTYITFVDSDDYLEDFTLEHYAKIISTNPNIDYILTDSVYYSTYDYQKKTLKNHYFSKKDFKEGISSPLKIVENLRSDLHSPCMFCYKANFLFSTAIKFIEPHIIHQDNLYCTSIGLRANAIYINTTPLYTVVLSKNSTLRSAMTPERHKKEAYAYITLLREYDKMKNAHIKKYKKMLTKNCRYFAKMLIKHFDKIDFVSRKTICKDISKYYRYFGAKRLVLLLYYRYEILFNKVDNE